MAVALHDLQQLQPFDNSSTSGIGSRWKRWIRAFELYVEGKEVTDIGQKKSLLLYCAGMDVQDVFYTLPAGDGVDDYAKAKDALNKHFNPLLNVPFERHKFRTTSQNEGETIEQYIVHLRQKAEMCEFGDANAVNIQITDQIIKKCRKHELRRMLLEKGRALMLQQVRDISRAFEDLEQQASTIEGAVQEINKLSVKSKTGGMKSELVPRNP